MRYHQRESLIWPLCYCYVSVFYFFEACIKFLKFGIVSRAPSNSMMKLFEKVIKDGKKLTIFGKMIYHRCFSVSDIRFRNSCNDLNFRSQVYLPDILTIFLHFKPLLKNFCSEISLPVSTCSK